MLRSMTAYGRACCSTPFGRLTVEIQSLNRRHLEIHTCLPREWLGFDSEIKERIGQEIHRGHLTVTVTAVFERESPVAITPNLPLALQLKEGWEKVAKTLNVSLDSSFLLQLLSKEPALFLYEVNVKDEEEVRKALQQALEQCLEQFISMKKQEGLRLLADIVPRLERMRASVQEIQTRAPKTVEKFRKKLKERLEQVLEGSIDNEEKILREVCVYAEKVDIAEEITRFDSHLTQMFQLIRDEASSVGKTFEFLLQELNREVNTIAAKAADAEVGRLVVEIKTELERVREQIQNVE
jgi:uncharacterized protein (TIGR00255 family)